jgi:hypothetical protein
MFIKHTAKLDYSEFVIYPSSIAESDYLVRRSLLLIVLGRYYQGTASSSHVTTAFI